MTTVAQQFKERPILFSGKMVRAILDGRKTQTRRVVKPPAPHGATGAGFIRSNGPSNGLWSWLSGDPKDSDTWGIVGDDFRGPYGVPGDRLWVRETFSLTAVERESGPKVWYRADNDRPTWAERRWGSAMHMPRWACRLVLEVKAVRVERLNEISEDDAYAEGLSRDRCSMKGNGVYTDSDARRWYRHLWDSINTKRGHPWASNPWVWVVEFERVNDSNNSE